MIQNRRVTDYEDLHGLQTPADDADLRQFVSFVVGDQHYGVDIMAVREIKAWTGTTPLPNSPAHVRGVINLRGAIVPVIDLRKRFGHELTEATSSHVVVIVAIGDIQNGLLVDAVSDIVTVNRKDISPIPTMDGEDRNPYFQGLITGLEELVAIIALDQLASHRVNDQSLNSASA
jgi:purine-binding chemotaxis protein CheW